MQFEAMLIRVGMGQRMGMRQGNIDKGGDGTGDGNETK